MNWSAIVGSAPGRRQSLAIALGFAAYYGGVGAFTPFSALYYQHLGFRGLELGILTSLPALGTSLTAPFWGVLADRLSAHRAILRIVLGSAMLATLVISQLRAFVPFLLWLAVLAFAMVPVPSMWDSYAVSSVNRGGAPYGVLRLGGSLGFISMVVAVGMLMSGGMSNRFIFVYATLHLVGVVATLGLPPLSERHERSFFEGLASIFRQRRFVLLLVIAYICGSALATITLYLGVHLASLGSSTATLGVALAFSASSEIPVIGFGSVILRRLGTFRMITIALTMYCVRFLLLSYATDVGWVYAAQAMHGLSFGMFLVASVNQAHRTVGLENAATAQALLTTMSFRLGIITGAMVGGVAIDSVGTAVMYRGVAVAVAIGLAVHLSGRAWTGRQQG